MSQKIKKYFSIFNRLNKKWLFLALFFFVIFGLFFTFQPALAQLQCNWGDVACATANFVFSILIKIVVLLVFALPLLISAMAVGVVALILGWIISPNFISLKFTQNPFVDIGLSITKGFANMGFILFLVVIALATILRIEEYKAKKTLTTLILIALLVNFSPVLCGVVIDFTNIVMNFFLSNITGINGFSNFVMSAANSIWNSLWSSGLDLWANIAAAMQVIIGIAFNWFATFIFILFSALFIMRYIMLWILVIVSPIAFVSYILPMTKRGQSILNWRKWWEQLISWSIIGVIAGFFLYLGFTMIVLINADIANPLHPWGTISHPDQSGWGLMNNILPFLIPLVLLWVAYKETKRTSAMFAGEIISATEKIGKTAVTATAMIATAGAGMAVGLVKGAAGKAGGRIKGAVGTMADKDRWEGWKKPPTPPGGPPPPPPGLAHKIAAVLGEAPARVLQKGAAVKGEAKYAIHEKGVGLEMWKLKHPDLVGKLEKTKESAKKGFDRVILGREEKEKKGRALIPEEIQDKVRYAAKTTTETKTADIKDMLDYKIDKLGHTKFKDPKTGKLRRATPVEEKTKKVEWEEEKTEWVKTETQLTEKELKEGHQFNMVPVAKPGIAPEFKKVMKTIDEGLNEAVTSEVEKRLAVISLEVSRELDKIKSLGDKIDKGESIDFDDDIKGLKGGIEEAYNNFGYISEEVKEKIKKRREDLEKKAEEEMKKGGIIIPKISDLLAKTIKKKKKP